MVDCNKAFASRWQLYVCDAVTRSSRWNGQHLVNAPPWSFEMYAKHFFTKEMNKWPVDWRHCWHRLSHPKTKTLKHWAIEETKKKPENMLKSNPFMKKSLVWSLQAFALLTYLSPVTLVFSFSPTSCSDSFHVIPSCGGLSRHNQYLTTHWYQCVIMFIDDKTAGFNIYWFSDSCSFRNIESSG